MFYYRYDDKYELIEKTTYAITGNNVVYSYEDIDIHLFRVIVGYIGEDGQMLRHTKLIRNAELVSRQLNEIQNRQVETELDIDFRLSMLELGLV